jgi:hypothetical protein
VNVNVWQLSRRVVRRARALLIEQPVPTDAPTTQQAPESAILDAYATSAPSPQLAVDIFKGEWSSAFPEFVGVEAGSAPLFADSRIEWLMEQFDARDKCVLELGPLEGAHTWMLERRGARVVAVEGNSRAFLKCLITKSVLEMTNATFLHGDFVAHLEQEDTRYDLVLASGVLYHMQDPLRLLDLMAGLTDELALWTHYFDRDRLTAAGFARQFADAATPVTTRFGSTYLLHPRQYLEALQWGGFCGGPAEVANWLERDDLLDYLRALGYTDVTIGFDEPDSQNGPSILLLARRATHDGSRGR